MAMDARKGRPSPSPAFLLQTQSSWIRVRIQAREPCDKRQREPQFFAVDAMDMDFSPSFRQHQRIR